MDSVRKLEQLLVMGLNNYGKVIVSWKGEGMMNGRNHQMVNLVKQWLFMPHHNGLFVINIIIKRTFHKLVLVFLLFPHI